MNRGIYIDNVISHYRKHWGHDCKSLQWRKGPTHKHPPNFRVLEYAPNKHHNMWAYGTVGMSNHKHEHAIELHMFSPYQSERMVELLTIVASFHYNDERLGLNHTISFGEPWLEFEALSLGDLVISFLWLIPVTESEVKIIEIEGVEGLESKFENKQFNYLDPNRGSVV
jgi:hypothetical protein